MEVSAAYILSFVLSPERDLLTLLGQRLVPALSASIFNISLHTFIGLYVMTQIFRFASQLFFGHGFFDPLFGLTGRGGFFGPRLLGGFKVILDTLFFPFVVFHLPLLRSRETAIERWSSFQKYQDESPGFLGHLGLFLTPLSVFLSLYAPLMMGLTLFDGVKIRNEETKNLEGPDPEDLKSYEIYSSELYGFKTLSSLAEGRFLLIPQFDLSRTQGRLKLSPHILVYDQRESIFLELKLKATLRLGPLIQKSRGGVPFWNQYFPELTKTYSLMSSEQKQGKQVFNFKDRACEDVQKLVRSSFELGARTLVDHTFEYGPFLKGFVELRRSLLSVVGSEIPPEVDFYQLGDTTFLRFRQLYDLPNRESAIEQTFLPLCVTRSPVFVLKSDSDLPSAISREDFLAEFFEQSEWRFGEQRAITNPLPKKKEEVNVFHLLDYAQWDELEKNDFERLEEGISYFFFDLGHQALNASNFGPELKTEVENSMVRMIDLLTLNRKKDRTLITRGLIIYLQQTLEAFKNENKNYFGLIKGSQKELWER